MSSYGHASRLFETLAAKRLMTDCAREEAVLTRLMRQEKERTERRSALRTKGYDALPCAGIISSMDTYNVGTGTLVERWGKLNCPVCERECTPLLSPTLCANWTGPNRKDDDRQMAATCPECKTRYRFVVR